MRFMGPTSANVIVRSVPFRRANKSGRGVAPCKSNDSVSGPTSPAAPVAGRTALTATVTNPQSMKASVKRSARLAAPKAIKNSGVKTN